MADIQNSDFNEKDVEIVSGATSISSQWKADDGAPTEFHLDAFDKQILSFYEISNEPVFHKYHFY
jgi:hypothetical protein